MTKNNPAHANNVSAPLVLYMEGITHAHSDAYTSEQHTRSIQASIDYNRCVHSTNSDSMFYQ